MRLLRTLKWAKRVGTENPERLLSLLMEAHEIDRERGDLVAAWRQGFERGYKEGSEDLKWLSK